MPDRTPMREHETSAPSLGAVPAVATEAMKRAGLAFALQIRMSADYTWHDYMADLWTAMLTAAPPTAMAEAVASARAEGVKEGLERAATRLEARADYFGSSPGYRNWDDAARSYRASAKEIRALLPAPPTPKPAETQNHQATERDDASI